MSKKGPEFGRLDLDLYTVVEAAVRIGVNKRTIYDAIKTGHLRAMNFGGSSGIRIRKEALVEWMESPAISALASRPIGADAAARRQPRAPSNE